MIKLNKILNEFAKSINEKQLKGLEGISPNQTLDKISKVQKLKIIKAPGNIIDFIVPDWAKGSRNFWQVIGTGKIKKNISGEFYLEGKGPMKSSPTFKTMDDLIDGVDWKSMEQTRRFNEGSNKPVDSLTEKLPNDFATIPNNGHVNGALKHLQHHMDIISKNVKAGKGVYKKDLMKMANIIKSLQMYEGINEENEPTNPELWDRAIAAAKAKYDVYPSAYANAFASKWYKEKGGDWKTKKD